RPQQCSSLFLSFAADRKGNICWNLSDEIFSQQSRLQFDTAPVRDVIAEDRMLDHLLHALFEPLQEQSPGMLMHQASVEFLAKVILAELMVIEQPQDNRIH